MQEMIHTLSQCSAAGDSVDAMSVTTIREFEIELETLQSKVDHLKSQNDLLTLTLEESKAHCNHVTMLVGKYESNSTAFQLALSYSDQALEAYDVLVDLLESERAILIANSRATGLRNFGRFTQACIGSVDLLNITQSSLNCSFKLM